MTTTRKGSLQQRTDDADAFIRSADGRSVRASDDLAELMGEDFVWAVTGGDEVIDDHRDRVYPEELGGPFVETTAADEFAAGTDESNPADATREALPRPMGDLFLDATPTLTRRG